MMARKIPGWCDYEDFYAFLIREAPAGATFVEVGCLYGAGLEAFIRLTNELRGGFERAGFVLYAVDTWDQRDVEPHLRPNFDGSGHPFNDFADFMRENECLQHIRVIRESSARAARLFDDGEAWSVFIDADHSLDAVTADIKAWSRVAKRYLCGHDYDLADVRLAVDTYHFQHGDESELSLPSKRCWRLDLGAWKFGPKGE